jgi:hypothetical protein
MAPRLDFGMICSLAIRPLRKLFRIYIVLLACTTIEEKARLCMTTSVCYCMPLMC